MHSNRFIVNNSFTSGPRWPPFLKAPLTALNATFDLGAISSLFLLVKLYLCAKFGAFSRKWTIQCKICTYLLYSTFYASADTSAHCVPILMFETISIIKDGIFQSKCKQTLNQINGPSLFNYFLWLFGVCQQEIWLKLSQAVLLVFNLKRRL